LAAEALSLFLVLSLNLRPDYIHARSSGVLRLISANARVEENFQSHDILETAPRFPTGECEYDPDLTIMRPVSEFSHHVCDNNELFPQLISNLHRNPCKEPPVQICENFHLKNLFGVQIVGDMMK
jgi:hypothetical protein